MTTNFELNISPLHTQRKTNKPITALIDLAVLYSNASQSRAHTTVSAQEQYLYIIIWFEAVQLVQQFQHCSLYFSVAGLLAIESTNAK